MDVMYMTWQMLLTKGFARTEKILKACAILDCNVRALWYLKYPALCGQAKQSAHHLNQYDYKVVTLT